MGVNWQEVRSKWVVAKRETEISQSIEIKKSFDRKYKQKKSAKSES
jgi:hypothetical protein